MLTLQLFVRIHFSKIKMRNSTSPRPYALVVSIARLVCSTAATLWLRKWIKNRLLEDFLRDICGEYFLRHPAAIGGVGHIVEIDESAWTKRKYNHGCAVSNQWVFGSIDRDTRDCFAVLVDHRDASTLPPIMNEFIYSGTTTSPTVLIRRSTSIK